MDILVFPLQKSLRSLATILRLYFHCLPNFELAFANRAVDLP